MIRSRSSLALVFGVALAGSTFAPIAAGETPGPELIRKAKNFIGNLIQERFDAAAAMVDPSAKTLTADELSAAWSSFLLRYGRFQTLGGAHVERVGENEVVLITTQFENKTLESKVVFGSSGGIIGLLFSSAQKQEQTYVPSASVDAAAYIEQDFTVTDGDVRLPGTLTLPKNRPPYVAVVLVPGAGPSDRDESIGPNKPMRDVALGLATRGIATLRYDKRTFVYGTRLEIKNLTYREEVVDDAVEAIAQLRQDDRIYRDRVFVLGHGLAGKLAPAIAHRARPIVGSGYLAGVIIMGGAARPLAETMIDYLNHIAMEDGEFSLQERSSILSFQSGIEAMLEKGDRDFQPVMGITYTYLKAMNDYNPIRSAQRLRIPILIAQGERDCQVTVSHDFQAWKDALSERKDVTLHLYPKLNHFFMEGNGPSYPVEYQRPGHVAEEFLDDVAAWVKARK